jgi:hypothetical protein
MSKYSKKSYKKSSYKRKSKYSKKSRSKKRSKYSKISKRSCDKRKYRIVKTVVVSNSDKIYDVDKLEKLNKQNIELTKMLEELLLEKENNPNTIQKITITATHQLQYYKECPISLEEFKVGDKVCILPCGHFFSEASFNLIKNKQCSLCRQEF